MEWHRIHSIPLEGLRRMAKLNPLIGDINPCMSDPRPSSRIHEQHSTGLVKRQALLDSIATSVLCRMTLYRLILYKLSRYSTVIWGTLTLEQIFMSRTICRNTSEPYANSSTYLRLVRSWNTHRHAAPTERVLRSL